MLAWSVGQANFKLADTIAVFAKLNIMATNQLGSALETIVRKLRPKLEIEADS